MKVLIEVPDDHKRVIDNLVEDGKCYLLPHEVGTNMALAIRNGKVISEMTNGEVIKALFPEHEFGKNKLYDERLTSSLGLDIMECLTEDIYVSRYWFNAPYEEEVRE